MRVRLDTRFLIDVDRWVEAEGSGDATVERNISYYISDANSCLPATAEEGGPAYVQPRNWHTRRTTDLFEDTVLVACTWSIECAAVDWITYRANPPWGGSVGVPEGRARHDIAWVIGEELAAMALLCDSGATIQVLHPYEQVFDDRWRTSSRSRRPGPEWIRRPSPRSAGC
ncbi:hypothetical protein ACFYUY_04750 [Kitasatospora sp. NPDC004745]|uniref:hypothetical protein n=1 Tax=Kitasatospora sp. NPDC004745 TaxID=3364019 RepID=UPI0036C33A14